MPIKIILLGQPLSTNNIYRTRGGGRGRFMLKKARELKDSYEEQVYDQYKGPILECPLTMKICLFFGDKKRRDRDNYHKLSIDSLQGIIYEDDSQIMEATVFKKYDKENPRIEILVNKL